MSLAFSMPSKTARAAAYRGPRIDNSRGSPPFTSGTGDQQGPTFQDHP
jgi:hypothetical protein